MALPSDMCSQLWLDPTTNSGLNVLTHVPSWFQYKLHVWNLTAQTGPWSQHSSYTSPTCVLMHKKARTHLCHIHIAKTAEWTVRRRKGREQTDAIALSAIKAWSIKFKICKIYSTCMLTHSNLWGCEKPPITYNTFQIWRIHGANHRVPRQTTCASTAHSGTCTMGWPPADAFTAPRLPSVS